MPGHQDCNLLPVVSLLLIFAPGWSITRRLASVMRLVRRSRSHCVAIRVASATAGLRAVGAAPCIAMPARNTGIPTIDHLARVVLSALSAASAWATGLALACAAAPGKLRRISNAGFMGVDVADYPGMAVTCVNKSAGGHMDIVDASAPVIGIASTTAALPTSLCATSQSFNRALAEPAASTMRGMHGRSRVAAWSSAANGLMRGADVDCSGMVRAWLCRACFAVPRFIEVEAPMSACAD